MRLEGFKMVNGRACDGQRIIEIEKRAVGD